MMRLYTPGVDAPIRHKFEEWAQSQYWVLKRTERGDYMSGYVEYAFMGWCASCGFDYLTVP